MAGDRAPFLVIQRRYREGPDRIEQTAIAFGVHRAETACVAAVRIHEFAERLSNVARDRRGTHTSVAAI